MSMQGPEGSTQWVPAILLGQALCKKEGHDKESGFRLSQEWSDEGERN
jgi:hypothetical protein